MQAVILVGGEGTRLRPLTYTTPKPMVPIMNVPFLARTMERLYAVGIREVILAAGYLPEAITQYFGDGSSLDMKMTYVIEEQPMGTAGAIKNVAKHINGPFFVLNGDVLTSLDFQAMIDYHKRKGGMGALHLITVEDPSAFGCVVHDAEGRVSAFVEKPPKGTEPTNDVNAGTYLLDPKVLELIPEGRNVSIERETFPRILSEGNALYAFTTSDYWVDLGRPETYLSAHKDILAGVMPLVVEPGITGPTPGGNANIVAPVHFDADAQIAPTATVGPNVVLGKGCKVGEGAVIRDAVLWDNVTVEDGAFIEEAIVASGARIGAKAYVAAGSVIGHDVTLPAGTKLEPGARVGGPAPAGATS